MEREDFCSLRDAVIIIITLQCENPILIVVISDVQIVPSLACESPFKLALWSPPFFGVPAVLRFVDTGCAARAWSVCFRNVRGMHIPTKPPPHSAQRTCGRHTGLLADFHFLFVSCSPALPCLQATTDLLAVAVDELAFS